MIHNFLPLVIVLVGFISGIYTFTNLTKLPKDKVLRINFFVLGMLDLYVGFVYLLVLFGVIQATPVSELSLFMRSANLLLVFVPFVISWRMGL